MDAPMLFPGAINGKAFAAWVREALEQSAIRWSHLIVVFCGRNKNLESFAAQFDRE